MTGTPPSGPVGVAVLSYGTPATLADLEAYYTHIRRGRPPTAEQLAELRGRYEAIAEDGTDAASPLRARTEAQRSAVQAALDEAWGPGAFRSATGQKHAPPFIEDAVAALAEEGCAVVVGLVLAPHWSAASVGEYHDRGARAAEAAGVDYRPIERWHLEPAYLDFLAEAVREAGAGLPEGHHVLFTAHSLPERVLEGDPYADELLESATAVADRLGLRPWTGWGLAWQSAGRTPEPWRGPDVLSVIADLAEAIPAGSDRGGPERRGVLVCPQGFVADHLEVLYDLDVEARQVAEAAGLAFARTRSLNDDPAVMAALARRVAEAAAPGTTGPAPGSTPEGRAHPAHRQDEAGEATRPAQAGDAAQQGAPARAGGGDRAHQPPKAARATDVSDASEAAEVGTAGGGAPAPRSGGAPPMRVVVVGAGVAGLAAARRLLVDRPDAQVTVFEAGNDLGGKIHTGPLAGRPVDDGADAFLARRPAAVDLCRELGLGDRLVEPARRGASVWLDGELRPLPEAQVLGVPLDPDALEGTGLLSADGLARLRRDLDEAGPALGDVDVAVGELVRRRLGDEVFERLVSPLLAGVHAGDADALSVEVGAPPLADAARAPGSLLRNLRPVAGAAPAAGPVFHGLAGGTQQLTDALAADVVARGGTVRTGVPVTAVDELRLPGRGRPLYRARTARGATTAFEADAVVVAAPAATVAQLLAPREPAVAEVAGALAYASVVLVSLAVPPDLAPVPSEGTGFLVPHGAGLRLTACSWASAKWAHLTTGTDPDGERDDRVVLRASFGGTHDPEAVDLPRPELLATAVAELGTTMGLNVSADDPRVASRVARWPDALPQFHPGHLDRVAQAEVALAERHPGIVLAGAWLRGLGIPACIESAHAAVDRLLAAGW